MNQEKQKTRQQNDALVQQLEALKQDKTLSEETLNSLNARIEELTNANLTKEELAKKDKEKLQKEYDSKLSTTEKDRDGWKNRFEEKVMDVDILTEAGRAKAYRDQQVLALIKPRARVEAVKGDDGKDTGHYETKVKWPSKDDKGKDIVLDLTVAQVIKSMKESSDYANLFVVEGTGGVGGSSGNDNKGMPKDAKALLNMTDAQYMEHRKRNPQIL